MYKIDNYIKITYIKKDIYTKKRIYSRAYI